MTIKDAILKSLADLKRSVNYQEVYEHMVAAGYYTFVSAKTPWATVSALLGEFIRTEDARVKRIKGKGGTYYYYLTKYEAELELDIRSHSSSETKKFSREKVFSERDLHILLSSFLKNTNIYAKTIFHEKSKNSKDDHQKWVHPDMVGISFLNLQHSQSKALLKVVNQADAFKIHSYELKKEINTDYELKKTFFQAVSNSSWANYGYLVAFDISGSLEDEMKRLNQSFGIGIIELKADPYKSKVLYPATYKDLDFQTIDKLCKINEDFAQFMEQTEKLLTADDRYAQAVERELEDFCDPYFESDAEVEAFGKEKGFDVGE
ncbi:MAG: hypothetical protein AAFO69_14540 [Bacteroidota bacterium]